MIELTREQRQAVALLDEQGSQFTRDTYPHVMEVFGREGWDDPAMDLYNDLDPRSQSSHQLS